MVPRLPVVTSPIAGVSQFGGHWTSGGLTALGLTVPPFHWFVPHSFITFTSCSSLLMIRSERKRSERTS